MNDRSKDSSGLATRHCDLVYLFGLRSSRPIAMNMGSGDLSIRTSSLLISPRNNSSCDRQPRSRLAQQSSSTSFSEDSGSLPPSRMYQDRRTHLGFSVCFAEPTSCRTVALSGKNLPGHLWYIMAEEAGGEGKRFLEDFGNIVRWDGPFGVRFTSCRTHAGVTFPNVQGVGAPNASRLDRPPSGYTVLDSIQPTKTSSCRIKTDSLPPSLKIPSRRSLTSSDALFIFVS